MTVHSKIPFSSGEVLKDVPKLLEGLSFSPAGQRLNKKDLFYLSTIILQTHYVAVSEGNPNLEIMKDWPLFQALDVTLKKHREWEEFLRVSPSDRVPAKGACEVIDTILEK